MQNCPLMEKNYDGNERKWKHEAWKEYLYNQKRVTQNQQEFYFGPLQCFCVREQHKEMEKDTGIFGETSSLLSEGYTDLLGGK